jgi:D-3-phosphoglycerate dehydrogenase
MSESAKPKIIVTEHLSGSALSRLQEAGEVVQLEQCEREDLLRAVAEADALVIRTYSKITPEVIQAASRAGRLKVIGRAGVGLDNVDVPAAAEAGITIVHTPASCTHAVADLVVGLLISAQRRVVETDRRLRDGEFKKLRKEMPLCSELQYQTLGVIGMGRIGTQVGKRLYHGFGMRVIYYDIREIGWLPFPAEARASAEKVYAEADVTTMHVPMTNLTRGMINAQSLAHFKKGAYLINTSRGPVVEGGPLADALNDERLGGAAIDVFDPEPPPPDHPLRTAKNCILTPHIASRTKEGLAAMNDVVDDVIAILQGKEPMYAADPSLF